MTLHGKVQNGVVVLEGGATLAEGTPVEVIVPASAGPKPVPLSEAQRRRAALAELLALPDENPGDTFSGADHDQVLYGDRK